MKLKYIVSLFLCFNLPAFASPGDDIWEHIRWLKDQVTSAHAKIQTNGTNIIQLNNLVGNNGAQIQQLNALLGTNSAQIQQLKQENEALKLGQITRHAIGDSYHGGIIFYVDESGLHGLIASKIDTSDTGIQWRNGDSGNKITNARGDGIGAGETNTRLIISQQTVYDTKGEFAALQASKFQVMEDGVTPCKTPIAVGHVCYGAWYLPSAYELQLMHQNLHQNNLSSFAPEFYWSSTEAGISNAWLINFSTGQIAANSKSNTLGKVRAVSRF